MTETINCGRAGHEDHPAVAQLVHFGQGYILGEGLCAGCAQCADCHEPATVLDTESEERFCASCARLYSGEDAVHGPDVVRLDSERYQEVLKDSH